MFNFSVFAFGSFGRGRRGLPLLIALIYTTVDRGDLGSGVAPVVGTSLLSDPAAAGSKPSSSIRGVRHDSV